MTNTIMQTASGRSFNLWDPRVEDVNWEDVANALSRLCRFNGHIPLGTETYTVAQHCCRVADLLPHHLRLHGLIHDAHEAYFGDWTRPLKEAFAARGIGPVISVIETPIEKVVQQAAGVFPCRATALAAVHSTDRVTLATERRDLLVKSDVDWGDLPDPTSQRIEPWPRLRAYEEWINRFNKYGIKTGTN